MSTPYADHEISLQGAGVAQPNRLADALTCAKNGHTTRVGIGDEFAAYVVPAERYRQLCELEGPCPAGKSPGQVLYEEVHGGPLQGSGHRSWDGLSDNDRAGFEASAARVRGAH